MAHADAYKVKRDYAKAVEWLSKAGEQGHVHAQEFLDKLYFTGNGVEQSYELAAHWLVRSAEQGHRQGQFNLGALLNNGEGVEKDPVSAYKWIALASTDPPAEFVDSYRWVRQDLESVLAPEHVEQGRRLASEWRPKTWDALKLIVAGR